LVWLEVKEGEAGDAVLEQGAGSFEGEGTASPGNCGIFALAGGETGQL